MHTLPERESAIFRQVIEAFNAAGLPYVIGGAFAVYHYGGAWRNTNDLDVYVPRENVPTALDILGSVGFEDSGEMAAGDRDWIYHALREDVMVDVIWQAPTGLTTVTDRQYNFAPKGTFLDIPTQFLPADDLVLAKIFTMNLHRCDWPDVLRIVRPCPDGFDWRYVINSMGENWPVLLSFIVLFDWIYPNDSCCVPMDIRNELLTKKQNTPVPSGGPIREAILDPWIYSRPLSP